MAKKWTKEGFPTQSWPFRRIFFSPSVSASLGTYRSSSKPLILSLWVSLCALHALFYAVKRLLHSRCPVPQMGPIVKLVIFMQIKPFISWQHTKANHHIYKSQVSLLSLCSLAHGPSIIADKRAVETMFTAAIAVSQVWQVNCIQYQYQGMFPYPHQKPQFYAFQRCIFNYYNHKKSMYHFVGIL
jgi:hypothetical protein